MSLIRDPMKSANVAAGNMEGIERDWGWGVGGLRTRAARNATRAQLGSICKAHDVRRRGARAAADQDAAILVEEGELPGEEGGVDAGELGAVRVEGVAAAPQVPVGVDLPDGLVGGGVHKEGGGDPVEGALDAEEDVALRVEDGGGEGPVSPGDVTDEGLGDGVVLSQISDNLPVAVVEGVVVGLFKPHQQVGELDPPADC